MTYLRIKCAICNRPVETVEQIYAPAANAWSLRVFCHGDSDAMELSMHFFDDIGELGQIQNQEGIAFATSRLPSPVASGKERP